MEKQQFDSFFSGHCLNAYELFGAHFVYEQTSGVRFTVWAPHAKTIQVVGEFNHWNGQNAIMEKIRPEGVFSLFLPNVNEWEIYKYLIEDEHGNWTMKSDPFAFYSELRPQNGSVVVNLNDFRWEDGMWMKNRRKNYRDPINIYEVHPGSWKKEYDGRWYTYERLAEELIPYCVENGYTHIELMPLCEHPFDGSWGYQTSGYYACTSRYGSFKQLMTLVNKAHLNNLGIILDFVPVHFVKDEHGLAYFDGTPQYEYVNKENAESQWGTLNFDLWKEEVRSFLMSAAAFWLDVYHIDGLRIDAVSNLIYWHGNKSRGTNEGALTFIKRMNYYLNQRFSGVMMIAEDSSDYPKVTSSLMQGGLGFDYKWDLGWMNDTLKYYAMDPIYRPYHHTYLNFSMAYFYAERFILPLSHDEVVHGKHTIVEKMWGSYEEKFAQLKNLYLYQFTHPGKKLNFMGNEIAHFREWDEDKELDWFLLDYPMHQAFARYYHDISHIYRYHSALSRYDEEPKGFAWIDADNSKQSVYSYYRVDEASVMVVVLNMTGCSYEEFVIQVPMAGSYTELLNTDKDIYAGYNMCNYEPLQTDTNKEIHTLTLRLAPYAGVLFERKK